MSEDTKPRDKNDPHNYFVLNRYLTEPEAYSHVNVIGMRQWKEAFEVVLAMPAGDERIKLLTTLGTALNDMRRRVELYRDVSVLTEQLTASRPDIAELNKAADLIKRYGDLFIEKFKQVYKAESERGVDMWKTAWPWYEHELYVYVPALKNAANNIARIASQHVPDEPSDNGGELLNPEADENNPVHYAALHMLLENPEYYKDLAAEMVNEIKVCLLHAKSLPAGPVRVALLSTLNRSLEAAMPGKVIEVTGTLTREELFEEAERMLQQGCYEDPGPEAPDVPR